MNILIIGFQRSGTTLLRRLINAHPEAKILHEKRLVRKCHTKPQIMQKWRVFRLDKRKHGGEKIPWYSKHGNDANAWIDKWFKFFGKKGRVVHIIRHPMDVAYSNLQRKYAKNIHGPLILYSGSVPRIIDKCDNHPQCMNVAFESLVYSPRAELERIFEFCGVDHNSHIVCDILNTPMRYFKGVNPDRGYAFKKEGKSTKTHVKYVDYNELLKRIEHD